MFICGTMPWNSFFHDSRQSLDQYIRSDAVISAPTGEWREQNSFTEDVRSFFLRIRKSENFRCAIQDGPTAVGLTIQRKALATEGKTPDGSRKGNRASLHPPKETVDCVLLVTGG
jgi:hypothetical protein